MKKKILIFALIFMACVLFMSFGTSNRVPKNLKSPSGTETNNSVVLIWDKPDDYGSVTEYEILQDGKNIGSSIITNFTVNNLKPNTTYSFAIKSKDAKGRSSASGNEIRITTRNAGKTYNILNYGALGDSITLNTAAIQKAIDDCSPDGTVVIPAGIFLSGALFLKSDMTLFIEKGGVLKGSANIEDYLPMIPNRFEGWERESFASLITAGKLDRSGKINVTNLAIRGEGKIYGGGSLLGNAMKAAKGKRARGRLICLMNCSNVDIQGLAIENSPCWTVQYTYCTNVTCHDLKIRSEAPNGDGIDPDSSMDSYIFNCLFNTSDDCIAIKSGKNPEGNIIGKPTGNLWITNCDFAEGISVSVGSEMSGGVRNVLIRDCKLGNLSNGLQIKSTKERGGFVENLSVRDCELQLIKIVTSINFNMDGEAAPDMPVFRNIEFSNINMTKANINKPVIFIEGFDDPEHYTKNVILRNIVLPENSKVYIRNCSDFMFDNVLTAMKHKPEFEIITSNNIKY
jgi:exo-poly-alpha-galacturonosidase